MSTWSAKPFHFRKSDACRRFFYAPRISRMTLTHAQKFAAVFIACTLVLSYVTANVRHAHQQAVIAEKLEREESLHQSTDKLVAECAKEAQIDHDRFGIQRKVCDQGKEEHDRTQQRMDQLQAERAQNDRRWVINFVVSVLLLNGLAYAAIRINRFFNQ